MFAVREKTVVVRLSRSPDALPENHQFSIEEILIELHQEAKGLSIMDLGEVETVCRRVADGGRLDIGELMTMADRRKVGVGRFLEIE